MPLRRASLLVPLVLVGLWFAVRWGELPDRLATSFDFSGRPRDAMGRAGFTGFALGMLAGMTILFGGLATWLPSVPAAWVNLPDKEHWLAPERRAHTLARLSLFLDVMGIAMGTMLAALFIALGENAIAGRDEFSPVWLALPAVLVVLAAVAVAWLDAPFRARRREQRAHPR